MYYGWRVVGGSFASQLFVVGFFTYAVSLLVNPVKAEFGASTEQVMYALTMGTVAGLVLQPLAGVLIDRFSVRWVMVAGVLIFALGLFGVSRAPSLLLYVLLFGLTMAAANAFAGSLCTSTVVSRWFSASRGRALGIAATGTSVGGIVVPWLISYWLESHDWRHAVELFALAVLVVLTPLVFLFIRAHPVDIGLAAETPPAGGPANPGDAMPAMSMAEILASSRFWLLGLSLGLLFAAHTSLLSVISPYVTNHGGSDAQASTLITIIAVFGLIGKLVFGVAADKFSLKVGLWAAQALVIAGLLILALWPVMSMQIVAASVLGLAAGGMLPVWGAMMAQLFGLASYGRAMGIMGPVVIVCVMPSFPVLGRLFDTTGSYNTGFYVAVAVTALSALLLLPLRMTQQEHGET